MNLKEKLMNKDEIISRAKAYIEAEKDAGFKKEVEDLIVEDVLSGCFTDFQLHSHKCWIEALEYVLDEEE